MILPIYTYGQNILRKKTHEIDKDYPHLDELIKNMFDTMYNADGVGLAAPQIGLDIRLFIVDLEPLKDDDPSYADFKKVFINPVIYERSGELVNIEEGCLSIPGIRESVARQEGIRIKYLDENFNEHDEEYHQFKSRCIQHEYDHIEGILFTDLISPVRKRMISSKLNAMSRGKVKTYYKVQASK